MEQNVESTFPLPIEDNKDEDTLMEVQSGPSNYEEHDDHKEKRNREGTKRTVSVAPPLPLSPPKRLKALSKSPKDDDFEQLAALMERVCTDYDGRRSPSILDVRFTPRRSVHVGYGNMEVVTGYNNVPVIGNYPGTSRQGPVRRFFGPSPKFVERPFFRPRLPSFRNPRETLKRKWHCLKSMKQGFLRASDHLMVLTLSQPPHLLGDFDCEKFDAYTQEDRVALAEERYDHVVELLKNVNLMKENLVINFLVHASLNFADFVDDLRVYPDQTPPDQVLRIFNLDFLHSSWHDTFLLGFFYEFELFETGKVLCMFLHAIRKMHYPIIKTLCNHVICTKTYVLKGLWEALDQVQSTRYGDDEQVFIQLAKFEKTILATYNYKWYTKYAQCVEIIFTNDLIFNAPLRRLFFEITNDPQYQVYFKKLKEHHKLENIAVKFNKLGPVKYMFQNNMDFLAMACAAISNCNLYAIKQSLYHFKSLKFPEECFKLLNNRRVSILESILQNSEKDGFDKAMMTAIHHLRDFEDLQNLFKCFPNINVNVQNLDGNTALGVLDPFNPQHCDNFTLLLKFGADPRIMNNELKWPQHRCLRGDLCPVLWFYRVLFSIDPSYSRLRWTTIGGIGELLPINRREMLPCYDELWRMTEVDIGQAMYMVDFLEYQSHNKSFFIDNTIVKEIDKHYKLENYFPYYGFILKYQLVWGLKFCEARQWSSM